MNADQLSVQAGFFRHRSSCFGETDRTRNKSVPMMKIAFFSKVFFPFLLIFSHTLFPASSWSFQTSPAQQLSLSGITSLSQELYSQRIPLHRGWNLMSFGINKCFHVGNRPTVDMIEGIEYVQVSSIRDILSSIDGQYSYVRGFDQSGSKTFNLSPWSDMRYMAAGYGYWIKVREDATVDENGLIYLEIEGEPLTGTTPIRLHEGWNLVGYLGNKVQYYFNQPTVPFPIVRIMCHLPGDSIWELFSSIDGKYCYVRAFDKYGAHFLWMGFHDFRYAGPGYGYWIKICVKENPDLIWDHVCDNEIQN